MYNIQIENAKNLTTSFKHVKNAVTIINAEPFLLCIKVLGKLKIIFSTPIIVIKHHIIIWKRTLFISAELTGSSSTSDGKMKINWGYEVS